MKLLNVLSDIEVAASILKGEKHAEDPLYSQFQQLGTYIIIIIIKLLFIVYFIDCGMERLDKDSVEFKQINTFFLNTKVPISSSGICLGSSQERSVLEVFKVNRGEEDGRYAQVNHLDNRRLLWHGTSLPVVAAILKSGLRIMVR